MSSKPTSELDVELIKATEDEIRNLEEQLARAKARLQSRSFADADTKIHSQAQEHSSQRPLPLPSSPPYDATAHFHLLLADSALPLGSFAFSSGLESYLAHTTTTTKASSNSAASISFATFLPLSISSYASTTLPFLLAAHREPSSLPALDDALDAAVVCTVGKRASVAQGRALLGLWERSFAPNPSSSSPSSSSYCPSSSAAAMQALTSYASLLRTAAPASAASAATDDLPPPVAAHLAPLFGAVAHILGLSLAQTAYVFMLGHVKALVSAAVRASVLGPYAAQRVLAAAGTREMIGAAVAREWTTRPEEAGQGVPVMDLWIGRHEVLYSRIFNS